MKALRITPGKIKLYGVFGYPLKHTLSPPMHQAGFNQLKLSSFYLPLELPLNNFRNLMKNKKDIILDGFNLTVPYKQTVMPYLDSVSKEAKLIGAVNTVIKKNNRWCGYNTDASGFITSLKEGLKWAPRGKRVVVIGAGGASRACIYGLCEKGVKEIVVLNRTLSKAKALVRDFQKLFKKVRFSVCTKADKELLAQCDLVVNATSLGLKAKDKAVLSKSVIPKAKRGQLAIDLIYNPEVTPFLKSMKSKGWKTLGGLGMLLHQGAQAFQLWTGKKAPVKQMRTALEQSLKGLSSRT